MSTTCVDLLIRVEILDTNPIGEIPRVYDGMVVRLGFWEVFTVLESSQKVCVSCLSKRVHSTFALSFEPSAMPFRDKLFGIRLDLV